MVVAANLAVLVVALGFLPPLVYLVFIRNVERHHREPFGRLLAVFFYGALVSVLIALFLESLFHTEFEREYLVAKDLGYQISTVLVLVVVVAPLAEEFAKGLAVRVGRREINEIEDGIVYGAAAGLGFSATENVLYEVTALLEGGTWSFVALAALRSITSTFLHATATGLLGYGLARIYVERRPAVEILPFYALAVLLHAGFNLIASLAFPGALFLTIVISWWSIRWTLRRIRHLDYYSVPTFR